jgi:hypothetical protein
VRDHPQAESESAKLAAGPLAAGWIVLTLLWRLADPYGWITVLNFLFTISVQPRVNQINGSVAPGHDRNGRFSVLNYFAIAVVVVLLGLIIVGLTLPEESAGIASRS